MEASVASVTFLEVESLGVDFGLIPLKIIRTNFDKLRTLCRRKSRLARDLRVSASMVLVGSFYGLNARAVG